MTEQNAIALKNKLEQLGFGDAVSSIEDIRLPSQDSFSIFCHREIGNDQLEYALRFEKNSANIFLFSAYELTLRRIDVPEQYAELESRMKQTGKMYDAYYSGNEKTGDQEFCASVERELKELLKTDRSAAELLIFKHWPENNYQEFILDDSLLKQKYDRTLSVTVGGKETPRLMETYKQLKQMSKEYVISENILREAQVAFSNNEHWVAYNTINYFLDKEDMYFFKTSDEAHEFSDNNISEYDNYKVINAMSVDELLRRIPYGENLQRQLADPDSNGLYNKDGNAFTDALIEHMEHQQEEKKNTPEEKYKQQMQPKMLEKKRQSQKRGLGL